MKIYKKPKIPKITCHECGCVFKPRVSELKREVDPYNILFAVCPVCARKANVRIDTRRVPKCSNCYFWSEKSRYCHNFEKDTHHDDFCSCFLSLMATDDKRFEDHNPPREVNNENT